MTVAEFFVPGEPKPQTRPRVVSRPNSKRGFATISSSKPVANWRERVHIHALPHIPASPPEGPVSITAVFLFRRPDGHYCKRGLSAQGLRCPKPMGGKGDVDNLYKAVADALEGLFFRRDAQVTNAHVVKTWCGPDSQEGVAVTVRWEDTPQCPSDAPTATRTRRERKGGGQAHLEGVE